MKDIRLAIRRLVQDLLDSSIAPMVAALLLQKNRRPDRCCCDVGIVPSKYDSYFGQV
jgi:hypothetical protein